MLAKFYLKSKKGNHILSEKVPWDDEVSRRVKFNYDQYQFAPESVRELYEPIELDLNYEVEMDAKERKWLKEQDKLVALEQLDLFCYPNVQSK